MIREATIADADGLADVHRSSLPDDLLPRLGSGFLRRTFYPMVLQSPNCFIIANEDAGIVNSFVLFARNSERLTKEIMSRRMPVMFSVIRNVAGDPLLPLDIAASLRSKVVLSKSVDELGAQPELYLIATRPGSQSKGIGSEIVAEGLRRLKEEGYRTCSVKTSSDCARKFYLRLHFDEIGFETRGRRRLSILSVGLSG